MRFRYCVLYIKATEQDRLKDVIGGYIPEGRGESFCPYMEYYKRGEKKIKIRAIFPGYVFLYTDLGLRELHELIRSHWLEIGSPVGELALRQRKIADPDFLQKDTMDQEIRDLSDLDEEEERFLDFLRQGDGLLKMSYGYEEEKTYHVMEGPLQAYEDKILKVDKHNKKAFLSFEYSGHRAQAGFECKPKAHWYPGKDSKLVTLPDNTEVDLTELKKKVMKIR